ncbi:MAG: aldehyde ferredoxin oxidoreductase family protein [Bacillota bacterium]|nr:aldehyde ferredoxin oxidoreductase family protein [Bacillota bacterium]
MSYLPGHVLRINLSTKAVTLEAVNSTFMELMYGGRGLAAAYLYNEVKAKVDPLSSENKIFMAPGLLAGTGAQGLSRWVVLTKSPLTGLIGRSVIGGSFGAYLRFAEIELLIIEGKADQPSYLYISKEKVEVREGKELWGLTTGNTEKKLQERYGKQAKIATIGPAGERQVLFSAILHQKRAAARCGVGTVMGSKNLKAIVLDIAPKRLPLAKPQMFKEMLSEQITRLKGNSRRKALSREGTSFMVEMAVELGMYPVRNFQSGKLDGVENLFAQSFQEFKVRNKGCFHCMTKCGQVYRVPTGKFQGYESEGPEYETIWAFGGQVGNTDPAAIIAFDHLCDELGLDTISAGNVIGFACELLQRGILSREQLGGIDLEWGNVDAIHALIRQIAIAEGIGSLLGKGVRKAAEIIGNGAEEIAMHVKGSELPAYDPRAIKGYGLSYATSNIGGNHMYGRPRPEIYGAKDGFGWTEEGKGQMVAQVQIRQAFEEVLICCTFGMSGMDDSLLSQLIMGATGWEELGDTGEWEKIGERIITLERLFNLREESEGSRDQLPKRFFKEPLREAGFSSGQVIQSLDKLLAEYYDYLEYSNEGVPGFERIKVLGLDKIIGDDQ